MCHSKKKISSDILRINTQFIVLILILSVVIAFFSHFLHCVKQRFSKRKFSIELNFDIEWERAGYTTINQRFYDCCLSNIPYWILDFWVRLIWFSVYHRWLVLICCVLKLVEKETEGNYEKSQIAGTKNNEKSKTRKQKREMSLITEINEWNNKTQKESI